MLKEFKEFAMRGNVMDLAIGIIIGGAFQKIVTSLVNDVIMPSISLITGKINFTDLNFTIKNININCGNFLTSIIDFLIIALSIFIIIKYLNKVQKRIDSIPTFELDKNSKKIVKKKKIEKKEEPTTKICPFCCSEINIKATRCPNCTSILEKINKN